MSTTLVKNGTIVTAADRYQADVFVDKPLIFRDLFNTLRMITAPPAGLAARAAAASRPAPTPLPAPAAPASGPSATDLLRDSPA